MTGHLQRELAPFGDEAWHAIDDEAARTLRHYLAGRRLVDFRGPLGYQHAAVSTGRVERIGDAPRDSPGDSLGDTLGDGVQVWRRQVLPLAELRVELSLAREEIDALARGADDVDLDAVTDAARRFALAEDGIVFNGLSSAGMTGIASASTHDPIGISDDYHDYPGSVARAVAVLQRAGVGGPYAVALGPRCYTGVIETTEMGGYPVLEHLRLITGGPVLWAPAVDGAVVLSQRGDDFQLVVGEDVSIAYVDHDANHVRLRIEETLAMRVLTPQAAVALRYL